MNKVIKNADAQLETFFKKIKLEKSAAIGHFGDVHSEEDMERVGKMVYEMVQLPKYDVIRKELQGSSGVVNFVTGNEYEPLVEFLVKTTFPPSSNDVYHMGHGSTLPEDYFVDASEYFGSSQGSKAGAIESRRKLEFLLRGTPKKMTLKWLEDHNLDGQTLNQYFAQSDDENLAADGQSPGEALVSAIKDFSDNWEALQNGKLRRDIDILFKKLEKQREVKVANKKIADENSGKLPQDQKSFYPVLTEDKIKMLTEELRYKRGIWTNRRQQLLNGYPAINIVDQFSGKTERNNDGFLQWNPVEEIREVYSALVHSDGETPEIDNLIEILKTNINDYRTTDKDLIKKKKQILDFFEKSDQEQVIKWMNHLGTFNRLMNSFIEGAMRHGKVILLSNIDSSALVTQPKEVGEGAYMQDGGLFNDFDAANSSNLLRDRSEGRTTRGKRTIVLVTSSPLQNLQASSKVEMDLSPVDEEEAEIIVRHSCAPYAMEARRAVELKMLADIEEKYGNTVTTEELNKRDRELASIGQTLTKLQDQLGYITPESMKKMEQMLIGMGQRDAIKVCRQSLESHVEREYNEDGIITGLKIDEEGALGTMVNSMTKAKTTDTLGLEIQKPKVKFDNYITNKMSTWGDIVGDVGFKKNELAHTNKMIAEIRGEISQIDFDLQGNIDKKTRNQLLKSRDGWKAELDMAVAGKHGFMKDFPHFTILYGKPGTGKCLGKGTPVLMYDGSVKKVEQIVEGDLLMGPDSKPRTVMGLTNGTSELYKVKQKLGDDYTCNDAHILSLHSTDKPLDQEPTLISAKDFCSKTETWRYRHKGWKTGVEFEEQKVSIDPYWLGLWLGDGTSRNTSIIVGNKDPEIEIWLKKWASENNLWVKESSQSGAKFLYFSNCQGSRSGCTFNQVKTNLRELDLLQNKHIPDVYSKNTEDVRLKLLAGLIDSDGYVDKHGSMEFYNVNERLAQDVLFLAQSLGFRANLRESIKSIKTINYSVLTYTVSIGGALSRIPTKLPRKQAHDNPQKRSLRYGISVEPIGKGEYFGFMVNGDHQFLLGDFTVTHNSVWGDALADLCDLMFYRVDIGKIKDKWVGNTGKFADKMISSIFASRNAVFLMDEVDRMMEMEHGSQGGGTGTAHEVTKDIVQKFLFAFGERMPELIERNIFVIMTTNNIEGIDTALLERSKGDVYEVEAADRPEDFLQFLSTFLETERADNPKDPWIKYGGTTDEEMWDYTIKFVSENIDLNALATVFAERRLSYRNLSGMLRQACRHHNTYLDSIGAISRGDNIDIHGLPMTTENLIKAAKLAKDASNSNADYDFGINTVKVDTVTQVRQMMENMELVPESTQHPVTGEKNTTYSLPKEVQKILNGELEIEDISPQYEVVEEVGPDGKTRSLVQSPPQGKTMQELTDSGMQEKSIGLEQEKTVPIEEDEDQDKKKALGSSTDYLFNFLQKEGVVSEKGKLVDAQEREHQQETARNMPYDSVENNGVFYYNKGQIFMAPRIV